MSGHIRRRGERSWEIKFDTGRDPRPASGQFATSPANKREAASQLSCSALPRGVPADPTKKHRIRAMGSRLRALVLALNVERYRQPLLHVVPHIGAVLAQKLRATHLNELYAVVRAAPRRTPARADNRWPRPQSTSSCTRPRREWGTVATNVVALISPPPCPKVRLRS